MDPGALLGVPSLSRLYLQAPGDLKTMLRSEGQIQMNLIALSAGFLVFAYLFTRSKQKRSAPYPPGPRKYPLIGNLLDIPTRMEWETYSRWSKEYGSDIIHLQAAGHNIVVLNSVDAASDLLDKRSAIYSDRPRLPMISELMGYKWFLPIIPYGHEWKERRRLFQKYFSSRNVRVYQDTQRKFVHRMLSRLLNSPNDFLEITENMVGGSTISLTYGLDIKESHDPYVDLGNRGIQSVAEAGAPGTFLVDLLPWLKYVPEWVPGAGFQKRARIWRKLQEDVREVPYVEAVRKVHSGEAKRSFVSESLDYQDEKKYNTYQVDIIKDTAGAVFAAGSDTTLSAVHTFFVAMLYFPRVQARAQEELDRVLKGRLPDFGDEDRLPYTTAIVKEVLRWKTVSPLGVPHCATEDDIYRGYLIPKGTLLITNLWAMLHDEERYLDPHLFKPERFLKDDGQVNEEVLDPSSVAFGFGRRLCPGRQVATSILWLTVATVLATFDISDDVDNSGSPVEPAVEYHSGMINYPLPFKCTIEPRSESVKKLVKSLQDAP